MFALSVVPLTNEYSQGAAVKKREEVDFLRRKFISEVTKQ